MHTLEIEFGQKRSTGRDGAVNEMRILDAHPSGQSARVRAAKHNPPGVLGHLVLLRHVVNEKGKIS